MDYWAASRRFWILVSLSYLVNCLGHRRCGFGAGLFNGWWVAYQKVPSFIVTLTRVSLAFRGILSGFNRRARGANVQFRFGYYWASYILPLGDQVLLLCCV